ncbi:MAG: hypothetical protein OHK005_12560 [Candidatus Methylacidiphilales bacterium]
MKIKRAARQTAKRLFAACLANGLLQPDRAREVVRSLVEQKPRGFLPVLLHFRKLVDLEFQRRSAVIESAQPVPPETEKAIVSALTESFGTLYGSSVHVNPDLIGGLRLRIGSDVIDGSIQGRLNQLAHAIRTS